MAGKMILLTALILAGCRGSVREGETVNSMRTEATPVPPQEQSPLRIDPGLPPGGPCVVRRLAPQPGALRGVSLREMDRVPVSRGAKKPVTSAWRIQAESALGSGTIVRVEGAKARDDYYLGDGIFAGCNQSSLASAYLTLAPAPGVAEFDILQLG